MDATPIREEPDVALEIRQLEESLLDPEIRGDPARLARLVADDFVEIGASGRVFGRHDALEALSSETGASFRISGFSVRRLSSQIVLAIYRVERRGAGDPAHSLRSSIWVFREDRWQILFHQGTPLAGPSGS